MEFQNIIVITPEDLNEGGFGFDCGILHRVDARVAYRNEVLARTDTKPVGERERRHILTGEIGELAVRKDLMSRGFVVTRDSWKEFNSNPGYESVDDIEVHDGMKFQLHQVKASEAGNRTLTEQMLRKYINSRLDLISFVAVRLVRLRGGKSFYETVITSQMMPRHIPQLATWKRTPHGYTHVDNKEFMEEWCKSKDANESRHRFLQRLEMRQAQANLNPTGK